jgi:cytoskeletal protein CcmA (bactofilin family)
MSSTPRLINGSSLSSQITVLPKAATMRGDMETSEDMSIRLDGEFEGTIQMDKQGTVHIAPGAIITTTKIKADYILVEGTVKGDLHARKGIELAPTARVKGMVVYEQDLDMHPGARVSGELKGPELDL